MKLLLAAMCALVAFFTGGCALILSTVGGGLLAGFLLIIFMLNLLVIGCLYGWDLQWRPAFFFLGLVDVIIALGLLWLVYAPSIRIGESQSYLLIGNSYAHFIWPLLVAFAVKGMLSIYCGSRV